MQILLPMAGAGRRFAEMGYDLPKPLIDVEGKPMIERVLENLGYENDYIFLIQKAHWNDHALKFYDAFSKLNSWRMVEVDGVTEGAACTALLAQKFIDTEKPLMIANTDQIMEWDRLNFYNTFFKSDCDGMIFTFKSQSNKHSYAKLDELDKYVLEVAEKQVISNNATVGVYLWRYAIDFIMAAEEMIERNIRTNNEFYICPTYNINIAKGARIETYFIRNHHPIGTPEELDRYLERDK